MRLINKVMRRIMYISAVALVLMTWVMAAMFIFFAFAFNDELLVFIAMALIIAATPCAMAIDELESKL